MLYKKAFDDAIRNERLEQTMCITNLFLKDYIEYIFQQVLEEYDRSKNPAILFEFKKFTTKTSKMVSDYAVKSYLKINIEGKL